MLTLTHGILNSFKITFPIFETTWKTDNIGTSNDNQISLPLESGGSYNFDVDWGDGSTHTITTWDDGEKTHTYSSSGTYSVKITKTINGWYFNDGGDKLKLLSVENWGCLLIGDSGGNFRGCSNLVINAPDKLNVSNVTYLFANFMDCTSITTFDVKNWDTSNVHTISHTFRSCTSLAVIDVSTWNTSNVTVLIAPFYNCTAVSTFEVGNWDTSNVTDFNSCFRNCSLINTIAIDNWTITSTLYMPNMLAGVTLTTSNYDDILVAWENQNVNNNVSFHAGSSKYTCGSDASIAKTNLVADHSWSITDGGCI